MENWGSYLFYVIVVLFNPVRDGVKLTVSGVLLRGEGASFPETVYIAWEHSYRAHRLQHADVQMTYKASGSGRGKAAIKRGPNTVVEYAGSDSILTEDEYAKHPDLKMFPTMAGALVLAYNIPGVGNHLNLTREQVVGIYNGTYTRWNDSTFQASNPDTNFPNATIVVVARADKSGSTAMFTQALSMFSEEWRTRPRSGQFSLGRNNTSGKAYHWDPNVVKLFGEKTRGMSGLILSIPYTIGYLSVADAADVTDIMFADLQNEAGFYITPNTHTVQSAMEYYSKQGTGLTSVISDSPDDDSYPIAGYTYFIVYMTQMTLCDRAIELVRYVNYFLTEEAARAECIQQSMVPLSNAVVNTILKEVLSAMMCGPDGDKRNVWKLFQEQKNKEYWESQTWRTPVAVTITLLIAVLIGVFSYFIYHRVKLRQMIDNNEWDIPIEDIVFYFDDKVMSGWKSKLTGFRSVKSFRSLDDIPEGAELLNHILQWPGKYKASQIGLRLMEMKNLNTLHRETKRAMLWMRDSVIHTNVVRFFGLTELDEDRYVISEYCSKGPMTDILQDEKYNFTLNFKFSLSNDIASGLYYLHAQGITHGSLRSASCLIDSRWNVKIADWEYCKLLTCQNAQKSPLTVLRKNSSDTSKHVTAFREFWTAPEILESEFQKQPSTSSDVYSFSIILQEIFTREDPYAEHADVLTPEEVLQAVLNNGLRPRYSNDTPVMVRQIMEIGWAEEPYQRPSVEQILKMLRHANPSRKSMLDSMMEAMEEYTSHLEERIEERTSELLVAKHNIESLLSGLIPTHIASKLANGQAGQAREAEVYNSMAVLSVEILDFPDVSALPSPSDAVSYLNDVNAEIESVIKKYEIFRVAVEGDNYTLVSGFTVKESGEDSAAIQVAHLALDITETVTRLPQPSFHTRPIRLRYGAHVGRVIGALMGANSPRFCILGNAVKMSVQLKQTSVPSKIHVSAAFRHVVSKKGFHTEERSNKPNAMLDHKEKTYWLTGRDCVHVDMSSELSTDSGIDVITNEKQVPTKTAHPKNRSVETLVTAKAEPQKTWADSVAASGAHQKPSQEERWREIFTNPNETPTTSKVLGEVIELTDVSNCGECSEGMSGELKSTEIPMFFPSSTKNKRQPVKKTQDAIVVESYSRPGSPDEEGLECPQAPASKSVKSKVNKVAPLIYV
ncbi:receptor-type guanylate cyclase gcy-29-like [Liolophura sinensis]|uniref:receptor-type guanylate cyclase gcy-29-like n=1 Tax=Liolophura sinensis TaxID=3198878 RepID=UPI0031594B1B